MRLDPIMSTTALGYIEVPFFSIAAVVADAVAKAVGVRILSFDTSGSEKSSSAPPVESPKSRPPSKSPRIKPASWA
jgi:hypothetical protein